MNRNQKFSSLTFSQTKFLLFLYSIDKESISIRWKWIDHVFNYWTKEYTFKEIQERWLALVNYDGPKADSKEYLIMLYGDTEGSKRYREKQDRVTGENNPAYDHGGKFSPFSKKFIKYENLSDEEKESTINELFVESDKTRNENCNNSIRIDYWLKRGYLEDEAKEKLRKRQSTFTLEKCVDELGEEEGRKRWLQRQEQWQNTLKSKPLEEIERINRAKFLNGRGYSKISQTLFIDIYNEIKNEYDDIYFATLDPTNKKIKNDVLDNSFYEWFHRTDRGNFFFDFYVKDVNKVIEFMGDYWHGEERGNKERDARRDDQIKEDGFQILYVAERDYRQNPTKVTKDCITWLNS